MQWGAFKGREHSIHVPPPPFWKLILWVPPPPFLGGGPGLWNLKQWHLHVRCLIRDRQYPGCKCTPAPDRRWRSESPPPPPPKVISFFRDLREFRGWRLWSDRDAVCYAPARSDNFLDPPLGYGSTGSNRHVVYISGHASVHGTFGPSVNWTVHWPFWTYNTGIILPHFCFKSSLHNVNNLSVHNATNLPLTMNSYSDWNAT